MAPYKRDMRRAHLVIPYEEPFLVAKDEPVAQAAAKLATVLPLAALMLRDRYTAWVALVFTVQTWLGESEAMRRSKSRPPGYLAVGMALTALVLIYLPLFLPTPPGEQQQQPE